MKLEQIKARMKEIRESIDGIKAENGEYSTEQMTQLDELSQEFETLNAQAETLERVEGVKARADESKRKTVATVPNEKARIEAKEQNRYGGFNSPGEFLMAVKTAGLTGQVDKRFNSAAAYEKIGEDGGFLVPEEMAAGILKKMEGDESLMAKATTLQVGGNSLVINVDEAQPWNSGVQAYWTAEGAPITDTKGSFKQASWRLHKVAALVKATDELLDDATALESYINQAAPNAILHKVNQAIINGNGIGKPTGIISSPFAVTVSKESMQTADTVLARNVLKMYTRMLPNSRSKAAWLIHPQVEEQLRLLKDDNDNFIYIAPGSQLNQTPYGLLLGRPVIPLMGGMPALGDLGDIMFVDLSYYYMIRKAAGIKASTSIHLLFDRDQTAFKFTLRVDGKCPFTSPVTTENGSYQMSAFVLLEAR